MFLIVTMPAAEPIVGPWRAEHDWSAQCGVPGHITVRNPFLPRERWAEPAVSSLARFLPFEVTLARLEDRPDALVLVAEPDEALRELTAEASALWPELPPHKGGPSATYQMTLVRTPGEAREEATRAIAPHLPLIVAATRLCAVTLVGDQRVEHSVLAQVD
jgi:hypothetical protein